VLNLVTFVVTQLAMGVTVLIARYLGEKKHEFISPVIGGAAVVFALLAAVLFGPVEGFAVGAVADMIGGTLSGYAINPLITLGAGSIGLTAGLLWRALPNLRLGLRTQISVFAGHAVGSIVINSLALHLFYNYPWSVLVTRIPNALVLAAVNTVLVRLLLENKTIRGIAQ
jgi:ECF transporter S component (folate family)